MQGKKPIPGTSSTFRGWSRRTTSKIPTRPYLRSGWPSGRPVTAARPLPLLQRGAHPRGDAGDLRAPGARGATGPLFLGMDTHALSEPAFRSALEVLAGNGVEVMVDRDGVCTPTPVISHAILSHNRGRKEGLADGS